MIKRCVEISGGPAHISVRNNQMVITMDGKEVGSIPVEDLGVVIVDHHTVTYTHTVLESLVRNNVALVICGRDHHPAGMFLPLEGHTVQAETLAYQASVTSGVKKRLWRDIVCEKIRNQAHVLEMAGIDGTVLFSLVRHVRSGDPDNIEGRASRLYWGLLFGRGFKRERHGRPPNDMLNYGYMVVRACVARAICGAGMHPSLGIHHRNRYNAFVLADDLVEPLRPMVDGVVYRLWGSGARGLSQETKRALLEVLSMTVEWKGQRSPFMVALQRYTASVRRVFTGEARSVDFPRPLL